MLSSALASPFTAVIHDFRLGFKFLSFASLTESLNPQNELLYTFIEAPPFIRSNFSPYELQSIRHLLNPIPVNDSRVSFLIIFSWVSLKQRIFASAVGSYRFESKWFHSSIAATTTTATDNASTFSWLISFVASFIEWVAWVPDFIYLLSVSHLQWM